MSEEDKGTAFVKYLAGLAADRGTLAALRRGLGKKPGEAPEMFPYIVPWLPKRTGGIDEEACYLVASLFAWHPETGSGGNLGAHMAQTIKTDADRPSVERRFVVLLSAHPDDLPDLLRQAVGFLKSKEVPVNWQQLYRDICYWDHPDRFVQRAWADLFWGRGASNPNNTNQ